MSDEQKEFKLSTKEIKKIFALNSFREALEKISDERFRSGKSFLLYGPPGGGREVVLYDYSKLLIESGNNIIWVTTRLPPIKIKEILTDFQDDSEFWDKHSKQIHIIDMFGSNLRDNDASMDNVSFVDSSDLPYLLVKLTEISEKFDKCVIIIDTVSGLFRFSTDNKVMAFVNNLITYISSKKSTVILSLNEGEEDSRIDSSIASICDFICHADDMKITVKLTTYPLAGRDWEIR